jgi:hexokinase
VSSQIDYFKSRHPCVAEPTAADMVTLRALSSRISRRSSAIVAAAIVALWELKGEAEREYQAALPDGSPFAERVDREITLDDMIVAFNGSVIERYPGYRSNCQRYIDDLVGAGSKGRLTLVEAKESSLLGAAVSLACLC